VRFQDAARDARAIVYAGVQADPLVARAATAIAGATPAERILARAVMNGESTDPRGWRTAFPSLFGQNISSDSRARAEEILAVSLAVADHGDHVRSQLRGAIVEAVTAALLARRVVAASVRRERRILFDGVRAEIHPYDVTVETDGRPEAYDCKWSARGIDAAVLLQLDAARSNAADEGTALVVALVIFDAERSCVARLARETAPTAGTGLVSLESLDDLAAGPPPPVGQA
jgi:hypothetical protein